jgi:hypothetical protein
MGWSWVSNCYPFGKMVRYSYVIIILQNVLKILSCISLCFYIVSNSGSINTFDIGIVSNLSYAILFAYFIFLHNSS